MKTNRERRRKYLVDPPVQLAILRQAMIYWLVGAIVYTLVVSLFRIMPQCFMAEGPSWQMVWYHLFPMVLSSAILLPIMTFSAVRFSHRFVGPMSRFRQILSDLACGESVPPVVLRGGDFWYDIADELNRLNARLKASSGEFDDLVQDCEELVADRPEQDAVTDDAVPVTTS
jgi:hypothetical protein